MIKKISLWFGDHPLMTIVILIIAYLASVRGHMVVSQPFYWLVKKTSNAQANFILLWLILPILVYSGWIMFKNLRQHPHRRDLSMFWLLTAALSILAFNTIMPYNAEVMHFPQYLILALIALHLFKNAGATLIFCAWLGFIDELAQYLLFYSVHFDYNDVCLDILGAAIGILTGLTLLPIQYRHQQLKRIVTHPLYLAWNIFVLTIAFLFVTKVLVLYCDEGPWSWHRLESGRIVARFWEYKKWGPVWHRIFPYEGTFWLIILPAVFYRFHFYQLKIKQANDLDQPV